MSEETKQPMEVAAAAPVARPEPTTDSGLETWTVPLAAIDAEGSPFCFRRAIKPDQKIRNLAGSIEKDGLIHPLVVRRVGEVFQRVSGFRRHAALAYLARRDEIEPSNFPVRASVLEAGATDDQALSVSFAENLARKTMDSTDRAIAVLKLRDHFGKSVEEIGDLLHLKSAQIGRLLSLLSAPEDVLEAIREGRYGIRQALALARVPDPNAREMPIRRSAVRRLRLDAIPTADAGEAAESAERGDGVPEKIRSFVRVAAVADPALPFRVTVRLGSEEAVQRLRKYLVRFAA